VYQHRVGALDHLMWVSYQATLKQHLRSPAWASWYEENAHIFSSALTRQVDSIHAELAAESASARAQPAAESDSAT